MKYSKLLFLSAVLGMAAADAGAETLAENPLTIEPLEVTPGEVTDLVMYYETSDEYQGFEFQIQLPEGLDYVRDPESDDENDMDIPLINTALARTHQFFGYVRGPGLCKATMISMRNAVIKSGGWILKIPVEVSESFTGMATGTLFNCRYGADDGKREDQYLDATEFMVYVAPTSISLSRSSLMLGLEAEANLTVDYKPAAAYKMPLTWTNSDPSVITVDETGHIESVAAGKSTITVSVTDKPEIKAVCEVEVSADVPTGIDFVSSDESAVEIYTVDGIMLMTGAGIQDLNRLVPGVYIVRSGSTVAKIRITSR